MTDLVRITHLKIAGDKSNSDLGEFATLSADDFWSMLQKYVAFDEPSSRCTRLKKFMVRQLKPASAKDKEFSAASQDEQDHLFDAIYGGRPTTEACRLLSVLLAVEEIACFDEIAFASWSIESGTQVPGPLQSGQFWRALQLWFNEANLSQGQIRWLNHCALATPDWSLLRGDGPWNGVSLAIFFTEALRQIEEQFPDGAVFDTKSFARAHARFARLLKSFRSDLPADFIPQAMVIVEGSTEEVLLPCFGKVFGLNFQSQAFMVVSAGGAKQVAKRYLLFRDLVAMPIVCILDRDAEEQSALIGDCIRDCDKLFVLTSGEIEDTFETVAFTRHLNQYLESFPGSVRPVAPADFPPGASRKSQLNKLWKERRLGDFDKIAFAASIAAHLDTASDVPEDLTRILKFLAEVAAENA